MVAAPRDRPLKATEISTTNSSRLNALLKVDANAMLVEHADQTLLINEGGQEVVLLTQPPETRLTRGDVAGIAANFLITGEMKTNRRLIIPSSDPLAPVTLRPAEATQLDAQFSGLIVDSLSD